MICSKGETMNSGYNTQISKHYAAYRPPIHQRLLGQILSGRPNFKLGVDIGCGTGVSSYALEAHCMRVVGLEPSDDMLAQTRETAKTQFVQGAGENLPFEDNTVDIVTFAGSLFYAKSLSLVTEIVRTCHQQTLIVVYDFEVQLAEWMKLLGIEMASSSSNYDHACNFSGYPQFLERECHEGSIHLSVTPKQMAHVLFSSQRRYQAYRINMAMRPLIRF
ncbi:class I SAM-dependent methyltransferase [Vibrio sonorensis]|uniref:class I SAM-dependent methyltransferase n=1 Tax=Vibrio sonorensis TaxID=1004316 RepID=UPI0009FF7AC7|nr:class I SAM-dependent methyltransferase [Vibrio sonorensis]